MLDETRPARISHKVKLDWLNSKNYLSSYVLTMSGSDQVAKMISNLGSPNSEFEDFGRIEPIQYSFSVARLLDRDSLRGRRLEALTDFGSFLGVICEAMLKFAPSANAFNYEIKVFNGIVEQQNRVLAQLIFSPEFFKFRQLVEISRNE